VNRRIRVLVADDHTIVAEGLTRLLRDHDFDVVGAVGDGHHLIDAAKRLHPDVIVTDLSMPGLTGLDVLARLRAEGVASKIIVLTMHNDANLATIAIRGGGLVAPALHDVNVKTIDAVSHEFADLVRRARAGGLRSSEMSDATITVTNLGDLGVESAYAIIYPPQVAIVGFGRIVERPWVLDGRIEPRSVATVSVSADHRATDGREAGLFLTAIDRALQAPEAL